MMVKLPPASEVVEFLNAYKAKHGTDRLWGGDPNIPAPSMGGTVAAEHGIGKLKRKWLPLQMTSLQLRGMEAVKRELDPAGILAPGNVL